MPRLNGVLETALYVADLARSAAFYRDVLELEMIASDERFCAFAVAGRDVLLLFRRGATLQPVALPGGVIPPHDGGGRQHVAFAVAADELAAWEGRLREEGVAVESVVVFGRGGRAVYFRDPDGHLLELATPGLWSVY
jgi:catechol 2,3-dioxygenase-like lactoylglutathione lyase family enzyme